MVSLMEDWYVASIRFDTLTLAGIIRTIAHAKASSLFAILLHALPFTKTLDEYSTHAAGIKTTNAAYPVIVTRYFSR